MRALLFEVEIDVVDDDHRAAERTRLVLEEIVQRYFPRSQVRLVRAHPLVEFSNALRDLQ